MRILSHMVRRYALLAVLPILALTSVGCDSNEEEAAPTFTVSSVGVQLEGGAAGIEFYARPNKDVILTRVDIAPPAGQTIRFNAQQVTVLGGDDEALQEDGTAYVRISGPWNFTFVGRTVDGTAFTSTTTVNVGA